MPDKRSTHPEFPAGHFVEYWSQSHTRGNFGSNYQPTSRDMLLAREELLRGIGDEPHTLVDIGAGRGLITAGLVHPSLRVISVEPVTAATVVTHQVPHEVVRRLAEDTGLPAGSADSVLVGYTLEYTNRDLTSTEIKRLLKPGAKAVFLLHKPGSTHMRQMSQAARTYRTFHKIFEKLKAREYRNLAKVEKDIARGGVSDHPDIAILRQLAAGAIGARDADTGRIIDEALARTSKAAPMAALVSNHPNVFKTTDAAREYFAHQSFEVERVEVVEQPGQGALGYLAVVRKPARG